MGNHTNSSMAIISPWIREMTGMTDRLSKYRLCLNCKIGYFTKRFSKEEMYKIYKDYRGDRYFEIRKKWEKWYNQNFFLNESSIDFAPERKLMIQDFVKSKLFNHLKVVIDVGGDKGQYIPVFFPDTERYVIDLSNRELVPGVRKLNSLDEIEKCDLIMSCHVLEHVTDPISELKTLIHKCNALYVEVPYGRPKINLIRKFGVFLPFHLILSFFPKIYSKFTNPSTGRINQRHYWLNQSEHLNFFEEESFEFLSKVINKDLHYKIADIPTPDGNKARVLQVLFY
jgi:hypothetical protein